MLITFCFLILAIYYANGEFDLTSNTTIVLHTELVTLFPISVNLKQEPSRHLPAFTYVTPCSKVSVVNFEHVIAGWGLACRNFATLKLIVKFL